MKAIILIVAAMAFFQLLAVSKADNVGVQATVAATYSCEIKQFNLYCVTNAQKVFINGQQYDAR